MIWNIRQFDKYTQQNSYFITWMSSSWFLPGSEYQILIDTTILLAYGVNSVCISAHKYVHQPLFFWGGGGGGWTIFWGLNIFSHLTFDELSQAIPYTIMFWNVKNHNIVIIVEALAWFFPMAPLTLFSAVFAARNFLKNCPTLPSPPSPKIMVHPLIQIEL